MGTCFGKRSPKRNSVCPSAENGIKRNAGLRQPEDMMRALEAGKIFMPFQIRNF